jgi:hypothetical protein
LLQSKEELMGPIFPLAGELFYGKCFSFLVNIQGKLPVVPIAL